MKWGHLIQKQIWSWLTFLVTAAVVNVRKKSKSQRCLKLRINPKDHNPKDQCQVWLQERWISHASLLGFTDCNSLLPGSTFQAATGALQSWSAVSRIRTTVKAAKYRHGCLKNSVASFEVQAPGTYSTGVDSTSAALPEEITENPVAVYL